MTDTGPAAVIMNRIAASIRGSNSQEAQTMTIPYKPRPGASSGTAHVHAGACGKTTPGSGPDRMPAGGWLREIATSENWRTTTIVQRHRDRATAPPPL